jgi:hypothetical protein
MYDIGNKRKIEKGWYNPDPGRYMSVIATKHTIQGADRQIKHAYMKSPGFISSRL